MGKKKREHLLFDRIHRKREAMNFKRYANVRLMRKRRKSPTERTEQFNGFSPYKPTPNVKQPE